MTHIQHGDLPFLCILVLDDGDLPWAGGLDRATIVESRLGAGFVCGAATAYHIDSPSITGFPIGMRPFNSKAISTLFDVCVQGVLGRLEGVIIQRKGSRIAASLAATRTVGHDVEEVVKEMVEKVVIEEGARTRRKRERVFSIFRVTAV